MRYGLAILLCGLLSAAGVHAGPIRFEQVPATASGYVHVDLDRLLGSQVLRQFVGDVDASALMQRDLGGRVNSFSVYAFRFDGGSQLVTLIHGDRPLVEQIRSSAGGAGDAVKVKYNDQDVYFTSTSPFDILFKKASGGADDRDEAADERAGEKRPQRSLTFGLTDAGGDPMVSWLNGPTYIAFMAEGPIVVATDLRAVSGAIDVLGGGKPSLAKEDPQGLRGDVPAGAFVQTAGFTAFVNVGDFGGSTTRLGRPRGGFDLDMFGSFAGKARLARFDLGEDEQSLFAAAAVEMNDQESALQLKNLMLGLKALVSLTQAEQAPLIDPLDIRSDGKRVTLRWAWPTARLAELNQLRVLDDDATTLPTTTAPSRSPASR